MIIGNGMLAKRFLDYQDNDNILLFASGVSNSKETNASEFKREFELLKKVILTYRSMHFVYFSTSSMYDPMSRDSAYVQHKINMEKYVQSWASSFNIFRVSQIIGRANNPTLVNFIMNNIVSDIEFEVWSHATRNLIAIDDVFLLVDYILKNSLMKNKIINIANSQNISVVEIIQIMEEILGKKAQINILPKGSAFDEIDIHDIKPALNNLNICFQDEEYYKKAILKLI